MFDKIRSLFRGKPSDPRALFVDEVEAVARSSPNIADVTRADDVFALDLRTHGGEIHRMFLENHFAEMRELAPDDRRTRLAMNIAQVGQHEDLSWAQARTMLAVVLRGAGFGQMAPSALPDGMRAKGTEDGARLVRRPFAPFLDVLAVIDTPTQMRYVSRSMVADWGRSADEVIDAALERFVEVADPRVELYDELHGPLFVVATNDTYETSRLLVPGWLASFRGRVEGTPIAIAPTRELLLVGGDARPAMIERLVDMAEREFSASQRSVSTALYTVDAAGKVVPYHSDDPKVKIAHEKLAIYEYESQKPVLAELNPELFVAKYSVFQTPEGQIRATAAWTDGVDTLLPKTESVSLVVLDAAGTKAESVVLVPWEAIADRLSAVPDVHPPRYRTGAFPDAQQMAELRARYP